MQKYNYEFVNGLKSSLFVLVFFISAYSQDQILSLSLPANSQDKKIDSLPQINNERYWNGSNITASALSVASTCLFIVAGFSYSEYKEHAEAYNKDTSGMSIPISTAIYGIVFFASGITGGVCSFVSIPLWVRGNEKNNHLNVSPDVSFKFNNRMNTEVYFGLRLLY